MIQELNLEGVNGGKKQHWNIHNSELIINFAEVMGWDKAKEVFHLTDQTLAAIFSRKDIGPAVTKFDQLQLTDARLEEKIYTIIRENLEHKNLHDTQRHLIHAAFDTVEKIVLPMLRAAIDYPGDKADNE